MFKRIVAQLSLSPSAVSQLAFYGRRLGRESSVRALAAVAAAGLLLLQAAILIFPTSNSNLVSPGDLIYGGVVSQSDLLARYDSNPQLKSLFTALNISRADLAATTPATLDNFDSLKLLSRTVHAAGEVELTITGRTYYMQPLSTSRPASAGPAKVLQGTLSSDGSFFAVMQESGDILTRTYPQPTAVVASPSPSPSPLSSPSPTPAGTPTPRPTSKSTAKATPGPTPALTPSPIPTASPTPTPSPAAASAASITRSQTAINITQNLDDSTKPAAAGDTIRYHLTVRNISKVAVSYAATDPVQDILEYATVTDAGGAVLEDGVLSWPVQTIAPGQILTRQFAVQIKNHVPNTPVSATDKFSYDLRLDNVFGSTSTLNVTPSVPKQIESAAASLPGTSPLVGSAIILIICALSWYFYARNRQLSKEVKLLRGEYEGGL